MGGKSRVAVTPLIRQALEMVVGFVNNCPSTIKVSPEDAAYASAMLDRLADFASENAVDPQSEATDSLARSEAWLDQQWTMIQDKYFDRLQRIAKGESEISDKDHEMLRIVIGAVVIDFMVGIRSEIVERLPR